MGKAKIFVKPTSMARKQTGQLLKLFGLWGNSRVRDPIQRELNPDRGAMKDGVPTFLSQTKDVRTSHITRRQIVLNRHFTEIISDVLATSYKKELDLLGVSITSIETRSWNKGVNIFYTTNRQFDEKEHEQLQKLVPHLRISIAERRLIGRTPHIGFVYDRSSQLENALSLAMSQMRLPTEEEETRLVTSELKELKISKDLGTYEMKLISKRFMAPTDMDNTLFGLDYPKLYDEVTLRLSHGRGEVSRMKPNMENVLTEAQPLFRAPKVDYNEEDPEQRLLKMKKFLISQQKKSENLARHRRKMEIMTRNANRWEVEEGDANPEFVNVEESEERAK